MNSKDDLTSKPEAKWQPIETAPQDRMLLLCKFPHRGFIKAPKKVGYWNDSGRVWVIFGGSWAPTHWMDLPDDPTA